MNVNFESSHKQVLKYNIKNDRQYNTSFKSTNIEKQILNYEKMSKIGNKIYKTGLVASVLALALTTAEICSDKLRDSVKDSVNFCLGAGGCLTMLVGQSIVNESNDKIKAIREEEEEKKNNTEM